MHLCIICLCCHAGSSARLAPCMTWTFNWMTGITTGRNSYPRSFGKRNSYLSKIQIDIYNCAWRVNYGIKRFEILEKKVHILILETRQWDWTSVASLLNDDHSHYILVPKPSYYFGWETLGNLLLCSDLCLHMERRRGREEKKTKNACTTIINKLSSLCHGIRQLRTEHWMTSFSRKQK